MDISPSPTLYVLIGEELHRAECACVPVTDRGFLFGDAVYETLRAYGGRPFLLDEHLARLRESAAALYLPLPWSDADLREGLGRLLSANRIEEGRIRITVTRGSGHVRARLDELGPPTLVITAGPELLLAGDDGETGVDVEISRRIRNSPDALDPAVKSGNLLNNILARFEMSNPAAFEVLLPNSRGEITEGSLSNLFLVDSGGRVLTPSVECGLLPGITRRLVMELAEAEGLQPRQERLLPKDLHAAREAWLTASTIEILPIRSVDARPLGSGEPGPITQRLKCRYRKCVEAFLAS